MSKWIAWALSVLVCMWIMPKTGIDPMKPAWTWALTMAAIVGGIQNIEGYWTGLKEGKEA